MHWLRMWILKLVYLCLNINLFFFFFLIVILDTFLKLCFLICNMGIILTCEDEIKGPIYQTYFLEQRTHPVSCFYSFVLLSLMFSSGQSNFVKIWSTTGMKLWTSLYSQPTYFTSTQWISSRLRGFRLKIADPCATLISLSRFLERKHELKNANTQYLSFVFYK